MTHQMMTGVPARKVMAGSVGAALAMILIYALETMAGIVLPEAVAGAINVIVVFLFGYYVPPAARDAIVDGPGSDHAIQ